MTVEITSVGAGGNEFGVGVNVVTDTMDPSKIPPGEGATWVGVCMAINEYMRSRGCRDFDCMKQKPRQH